MERRSCNRKTIEVSVYLTDHINGVSRLVATDISSNGVFLKTNQLYIPTQKCVKLIFALRINSPNVVRLRKVTAIVMHSQRDGVGMRFLRP
jgi:hypothetical protein